MSLAEDIKLYIENKTELDKERMNCDSSFGYSFHDRIEQVRELEESIEKHIVKIVVDTLRESEGVV